MALIFRYAVLRVIPDARRGECVNIGLAVLTGEAADVRIARSLQKVQVLNPQIDVSEFARLPELVNEAVAGLETDEQRHEALRHLGIISASALGTLQISMRSEYERAVSQLCERLIEPVKGERSSPIASRLQTQLKQMFRQRKILATSAEEIDRHRVVPNYPIDPSEGIYADFVLKNAVFHVTETADLRAAHFTTNRRAQVAALTAVKLDRARAELPGDKNKMFVVYGAGGADVRAQVRLMGQYADKVYSIESRRDVAAYMEHIMKAAGDTLAAPMLPPKRKRASASAAKH